MAGNDFVEEIQRRLYADEQQAAYAILDGASIPTLLDLLDEYEPEHTCLFSGKLDPEVEQTSPYLVRLQANTGFSQHVLKSGWGHHWGILALAPQELRFIDVRKHFRTFLRVRGPGGEPLLFRYYDPRVLRIFLPTCNEEEVNTLFGPVTAFLMEGNEPSELLRFSPDNVGEEGELIKLVIGTE